MGWLFAMFPSKNGRRELIDRLRSPARFGENTTLLQSCIKGSRHWYLAKTGHTVWIGLDLMAGGGKNQGWGYKDMDETVGPGYYDCPITYLDKASAPTGYAIEWRQKVREHHAAMSARPSYETGLVVTYAGVDYRLLRQAGKRRGWEVARLVDGMQFRMSAKQLANSIIKPKEVAHV